MYQKSSSFYTYIIRFVQYAVGILFVVSALLKINDPLGLQYKIDEYFDVFGWLELKPFSFAMAVLMNILEFAVGVALLLGFRMKVIRWVLLVLIVFFTFLTAFAFFSGKLKECGCMGNCIPLTAKMSFYKDLVLLVVSVILLLSYKRTYSLFSTSNARVIFWISVLFGYLSQMIVYILLPVWDCMPFQVGKNIPEEMEKYQRSGNHVEMVFVYMKGDKKVSFSAENFPLDFDSTYVFVERIDRPVETLSIDKGIAEFSVVSMRDQEDITDYILTEDSVTLLMVLNESGWDKMEEKMKHENKGFLYNRKVFVLGSDSKRLHAFFETYHLPLFQALLVDNVLLKTMCRTPLTTINLSHGTIVSKEGCLFHTQLFDK